MENNNKRKHDRKANNILNNLLKSIYDKDYKHTKITIDVNPNNMS